MSRYVSRSCALMKFMFNQRGIYKRIPAHNKDMCKSISSQPNTVRYPQAYPTIQILNKGYTCSQSTRIRKFGSNMFIFNGILAFFGFGKKEEQKESELILTIKRSILLMQRGELKKSEQMLHIALKLAQEQQNVEAITYIYDLMANLAYESGEFDKAEKLFVTVIQRELSSGVHEDDNKIIHMSLKLADIYTEKGDIRKAEEGFKFCMNQLQRKPKEEINEDTLLLWGMTLDWYAHFSLDQGHYTEAFNSYRKAYEMSVEVYGVEHVQNVILLNDLGTVCCLQNKYDDAIEYLKEAVHIGRNFPDMEGVSAIYINLGTVYIKKMMYDEAKQACQEGWKRAKKMNNEEALNEASVCLNEVKLKQAV